MKIVLTNKEIENAAIDLIKKCKRKGFRGIERKICGYNVSLKFDHDKSSNSSNELETSLSALIIEN